MAGLLSKFVFPAPSNYKVVTDGDTLPRTIDQLSATEKKELVEVEFEVNDWSLYWVRVTIRWKHKPDVRLCHGQKYLRLFPDSEAYRLLLAYQPPKSSCSSQEVIGGVTLTFIHWLGNTASQTQ